MTRLARIITYEGSRKEIEEHLTHCFLSIGQVKKLPKMRISDTLRVWVEEFPDNITTA